MSPQESLKLFGELLKVCRNGPDKPDAILVLRNLVKRAATAASEEALDEEIIEIGECLESILAKHIKRHSESN